MSTAAEAHSSAAVAASSHAAVSTGVQVDIKLADKSGADDIKLITTPTSAAYKTDSTEQKPSRFAKFMTIEHYLFCLVSGHST